MEDVQAKELCELFKRRMKARRKELGLTQIQLAERMNIDQSYISDLERGATRPRFDSLAPLGEALEIDPGYFVSEAFEFSEK